MATSHCRSISIGPGIADLLDGDEGHRRPQDRSGWLLAQADDRRHNDGSFYGGTISGRAAQVGQGIGVSKQFGPVEVNLNYVHDFKVENTLGGDKVLLNLTMPLQF